MKEIIDFDNRGHAIRFYIGKNGKQYGDDWDDAPYEHNAGTVYSEFIESTQDILIPFDFSILEPASGEYNSKYCKEDFIKRIVPCLIISKNNELWSFIDAQRDDSALKIYYGDNIDEVLKKFKNLTK